MNKKMIGKVLVVGASGLIGGAVVRALDGRAEVIQASRKDSPQTADITDQVSIEALFGRVGTVSAIVCVAGLARYIPWANVTDDDWAHGLSQKLMGQVNLVRIGAPFVRDGGSIILTTGILAQYPMPGSSIVTTVNAAVEGFVHSAAIEIGRGVRVNAVSPGWIAETMVAIGMDPSPGLPVADVAKHFVQLIESDANGTVLVARRGSDEVVHAQGKSL